MDFMFYPLQLFAKMQNIFLRYIRANYFFTLNDECGNKPRHENESLALAPEPRSLILLL